MNKENNLRQLGSEKETLAAEWLRSRGYRILAQNYRIRIGEIDLIAAYGRTIIFLEVKYRKNTHCGPPEAAVHRKKQQTIIRVAQFYLTVHRYPEDQPCRFDVIAIYGDAVTHYINAFGGM